MYPKRKYCIGDCNYQAYFNSQVGRGVNDISIFRGRPYQRGYGIGSVFKRYGVPLLEFLGRHLLSTGVALGNDMIDKKPFVESLRRRGGESIKRIGLETTDSLARAVQKSEQTGGGKLYKRKRSQSKRAKVIRRKRDIFS